MLDAGAGGWIAGLTGSSGAAPAATRAKGERKQLSGEGEVGPELRERSTSLIDAGNCGLNQAAPLPAPRSKQDCRPLACVAMPDAPAGQVKTCPRLAGPD